MHVCDDVCMCVQPMGLKSGVVPSAHTRKSVEGLNQEVSSVLEGNPILLVEVSSPSLSSSVM